MIPGVLALMRFPGRLFEPHPFPTHDLGQEIVVDGQGLTMPPAGVLGLSGSVFRYFPISLPSERIKDISPRYHIEHDPLSGTQCIFLATNSLLPSPYPASLGPPHPINIPDLMALSPRPLLATSESPENTAVHSGRHRLSTLFQSPVFFSPSKSMGLEFRR